MEKEIYEAYVRLLHKELVPAMGCTEPISVAYAAAVAAKELSCLPEKVQIFVSSNIIKNVKSVIVPNTGGLHGLEAAAAAGIIAGQPDKKLLVISQVTQEERQKIARYLHQAEFAVQEAQEGELFDIHIILNAGNQQASCRIAGSHTNVVEVSKNGAVVYHRELEKARVEDSAEKKLLTVERIVEFADTVLLEDVLPVLQRQVQCNMAIAREGLEHPYGSSIGRVLLAARGHDTLNRAKAYAAAASDARMGGCDLPVVINSGSGNQGITTSIPVVIYADALEVSEEQMYRALTLANLITLHLKSGIGPLSAYCGAISAGCGAAAGITYLYGGGYKEVAHTVVNALAINSGVICDGAKASCAAKIASAVEAGVLGMEMYRNGSQFLGGDGIVSKGVENTIRNVSRIASQGMRKTDDEIIKIMLS